MKELEYEFKKECNRLIERLGYVLIVSFIIYGILLYIYKGLTIFFFWHMFCAGLFIFINHFLLKNKWNNIKVVLAYLILCADIFFFVTMGGYKTGMDLFYIPMMLSMPIFFDFVKEKHFVITSFIIIVSFMILGLITRELFYVEFFYKFYNGCLSNYFLIINISFVLAAMGIIICSIYIRHSIHQKNLSILKDKSVRLDNAKQKLGKLTSASELVILAKNKDQGFYQKFILAYPDLIDKLNKLCPTICRTELEFCAYLKLNFSTKQIATYTNSTIKSVECKKYRIRKKFDLDPSADIYVWINSI